MRIKDLSKIDLPREKLEKYGTEKLQDHELLAVLLGSGVQGVNVLELSKRILKVMQRSGSALSLDELMNIKGLGRAKSLQILAIRELSSRLMQNQKKEILSGKDIWNACSDIRDSKKEHFVVFYLDVRSHIIERKLVSIGTVSASLVHPREVFEPALSLHASSLILAHNHPSGVTNPSDADRTLTKSLVESGMILGMPIQAHFVITSKEYERITID